jgi:hypothetical protein
MCVAALAAGHLSGLALSSLRQVGRGFAAQQLIEEWNARRALSAKVVLPACTCTAAVRCKQRSMH